MKEQSLGLPNIFTFSNSAHLALLSSYTVGAVGSREEETRAETTSVENDISEHLVVITAILHQGCANPLE